MFKYLPGIILVQVVTLALLWVNAQSPLEELLARVALPAILLSTVTALWFAAISRAETQKAHATLLDEQQRSQADMLEKHFQEREKLTRSMERTRADVMQKASSEREELVRKTHADLIKAERRAHRGANLKVGAAFTLVTVAGVGLLFVQFMTLGLLTITAASGALGGYLLRWKQTRRVMQLHADSGVSLPSLESADEKPDATRRKPVVINADRKET